MWAFLLPAQPGIPLCQLGVLAPSCDRVGRNFPFLATLPLPPDRIASFVPVAASLGLAWSEAIASAQTARQGIDELDAKLQASLADVLMTPVEIEDSEKTLPSGMSPSILPWPDLAATFDGNASESYWWSVPPAMTRFRARSHNGRLNGMLFLGLCEG
jgi:type VI secretion system protein ImpM